MYTTFPSLLSYNQETRIHKAQIIDLTHFPYIPYPFLGKVLCKITYLGVMSTRKKRPLNHKTGCPTSVLRINPTDSCTMNKIVIK